MALSLVAYQEVAYAAHTGSPPVATTFTSITWASGDLVTIVASTEDSVTITLATPTVTGLTFSAISGFPLTAGSNCGMYAWQATAASASSGSVSITRTGAGTVWGAGLWQWSGHNGLGNHATSQTSAAVASVSLTVSTNSAVVGSKADWNAAAAGYTGTPTVNVEREDAQEGPSPNFTCWSADWLAQAAGTRNYGTTTTSGTKDTLGFVEIKEAGATATSIGQGRSRTLVGLKIR